MDKAMTALLGASWKTSMFGLLSAIGYYFSTLGTTFPTTGEQWKQAIIAAAIYAFGRMTKDTNVSNAPNPLPESKPVA